MRGLRLATAAALVAAAAAAQAMPNFARREGFDCSVCHVNIPRLNRFGYAYRNAGFRIPSSIGSVNQPDLPPFASMNAARLQSNGEWRHERARGVTTNQGELTFAEATLYPLTGAFGRWFSSEGELSVAPEDFFEVENAYVRGTLGNEQLHGNLRFGIFHPWEGYGASDRPVTLSRPLFQRNPARFAPGGPTNAQYLTWFTPWGFDEVGLEGGVTFKDFNVAATVFNGLVVRGTDASPTGANPWNAQSFQGGNLVRTSADPNYDAKDYQVFANQFFGEAALSAHWYHGTLTVPVVGAVGAPGSTSFTDHFDRLTLYGTLPIPRFGPATVPPLWVLAGIERGWDTGFNVTTSTKTAKFTSQGWFGELWAPFTPWIGVAARYDWWDPSRIIAHNTQQAVTGAVTLAALNGAQAIAEYRHVFTNLNAVQNRNRDQLDLRLIYIF